MEPHAVVAESPVVADPGILFGHDAFNAQSLESCSKCDGAFRISIFSFLLLLVLTYALPPPIIKTSVSKVSRLSNLLAGAFSKDSSSGCRSKLSSLVLKIQIFHFIGSSELRPLFTGNSNIFPPHLAAGDSVLKEIPQSMKCYMTKSC